MACCVVSYMDTKVSEQIAASIIRVGMYYVERDNCTEVGRQRGQGPETNT
jgi:hypothetical protein